MALIYQKQGMIITDESITVGNEKEIPLPEIGRVEVDDSISCCFWYSLMIDFTAIALVFVNKDFVWLTLFLLLIGYVVINLGVHPILILYSKAGDREIARWKKRKNAKEEKEIIEGLIAKA